MKVFGLPRFGSERLSEGHVCRLAIEEELLDFSRAGQGDGGGEQAFAWADVFGKEGLIHGAEGQVGLIAADLSVEGRVAVDEVHGEAELRGEEVGGGFQIAHIQVCGD